MPAPCLRSLRKHNFPTGSSHGRNRRSSFKRRAVPKQDSTAELEELFNSVNCVGDQIQRQTIKYSNSPNLICILPGETSSVIVVGAHFDNEGSGSGVVDNWSGASLLPSIYQSLAKKQRKHTFRFIGFTDEEVGLVGSVITRITSAKTKSP